MNSVKSITITLGIIALTIICIACGKGPRNVTILELSSNPARYADKEITLTGFYFQGHETIVVSQRMEVTGFAPGHLWPEGEKIWIEGEVSRDVYDQATKQDMMGPIERYGKVRITGIFQHGARYGHTGNFASQILPSQTELLPWSPLLDSQSPTSVMTTSPVPSGALIESDETAAQSISGTRSVPFEAIEVPTSASFAEAPATATPDSVSPIDPFESCQKFLDLRVSFDEGKTEVGAVVTSYQCMGGYVDSTGRSPSLLTYSILPADSPITLRLTAEMEPTVLEARLYSEAGASGTFGSWPQQAADTHQTNDSHTFQFYPDVPTGEYSLVVKAIWEGPVMVFYAINFRLG